MELKKKELLELLEITDKYYRNNRVKIENYLRSVGDLEILEDPEFKGRVYYRLTNLRDDIIPIKNDIRNVKKLKKEKVYPKVIKKVIKQDPIENYVRIAEKTIGEKEIEELHYKSSYHYENIRYFTKILFGAVKWDSVKQRYPGGTEGTVQYKVWGKIVGDRIEELSEKEWKDLMECIGKSKETDEVLQQKMAIFEEFRAGEMDEEERNRNIGGIEYTAYLNGLNKFAVQHNFYPVCFPKYVFYDDFKEEFQLRVKNWIKLMKIKEIKEGNSFGDIDRFIRNEKGNAQDNVTQHRFEGRGAIVP
jgi:hypothetical protein